MTNRLDYQTSAGSIDPRITFDQLIEFCRLAQEDCKALADWAKIYEAKGKAKLWMQVAENFEKIIPELAYLGKGKTKTSMGFTQ